MGKGSCLKPGAFPSHLTYLKANSKCQLKKDEINNKYSETIMP
nr:hypothetical protein [uncultured bacterium]